MGISKITLAFVILGLAYCSGDKCEYEKLTKALKTCLKNRGIIFIEVDGANEDEWRKACSDRGTYKSCNDEAMNGCNPENFPEMQQGLEDFLIQCKQHGYSHASSTSVENIVLLIAALATLVPFV